MASGVGVEEAGMEEATAMGNAFVAAMSVHA
jgi:hypothetical protein